ncbi:hypothetical protein LJC44_00855 [Parabacteroides sp. OttesenSCG-928-G06]|nr:hypothetical protein [Parabacteroides sp. OttesenSCG-928-G06]
MGENISIKLLKSLKRGRKQLSREAQERIAGFVLSQRTEEGTFMDKSGRPDLYYTLFGWMLSYVLGIATDKKKQKAYLASLDTGCLDLIHYAAYMRCRMVLNPFSSTKIKALEDFNNVPHNDRQSPYTQFVWLSLSEDTGNRIRNKKEIVDSLAPYRSETGGYRNTIDGLSATTNATVAALAIKGQFEGYRDNADVGFLSRLQQSSGGFGAAEASPVPDLLSTATSLFMLSCYGVKPVYEARDFIESHWLDSGGFSATLLDDTSDVEYTFYGLLAMGSN